MSITETLINYMYSLKAKGITYSMTGSRTGRDGTGDCSGTIYAGLVVAGLPTLQYPFSTESEHSYLLNNGYELIAHNTDWNAQRGDIFVWGEKGSSNGAGGHTGVFIDADNIIHCNYGYNGVTVNDYNTIYGYNNPNGVYVYRLKNEPKQETKPTQTTTKKEEIEEDYTMTEFAFAYKGAMFYVTGSTMRALKNATEWSVLQAMYKQTHNGRAIVAVDWSNNAPTANAYFSICGYGEDAAFQNKTTQGIEDIKKALK